MNRLLLIPIILLLGACNGSSEAGTSPVLPPPPPPPLPVTYTVYTVTDPPNAASTAAYKPSLVVSGSDGSWHVEFSRLQGTIVFDPPILPDWSAGWVMSSWNLSNGNTSVWASVQSTNGDGQPDVNFQWTLTPVLSGG